jgi:holliday junction DNA helicase RuvA
MFAYFIGLLTEKSPTDAVIELNGIGYSFSITASTFQVLPALGESAKLFTYLLVREDIMLLYGFATDEERQVFKLLISVSGVGPRMAQTILSGMAAGDLQENIISNKIHVLTTISGVGKKTAERIVLDLRDKITKLDLKSSGIGIDIKTVSQQTRSDAYSALLALGYARPQAEKALRGAISENPDAKTEELLRLALRQIQQDSK